MSSEFLPVYQNTLRELIAEFIPVVAKGDISFQDLQKVCSYYRALGIVAMLNDADSEGFFSNIGKSVQLFLAGVPALTSNLLAAGRSEVLFDAIAFGENTTTERVALALPTTWRSDLEYEEDFLYARFLIGTVLRDATESQTSELLRRWEVALQGASSPRYDVCTALVDADDAAFESAFLEFLEAYSTRHALMADAGRIPEELAASLPYLSVEGLAVLRIAEHAGISTEMEYPLVPSLIRRKPTGPMQPGAWRTP